MGLPAYIDGNPIASIASLLADANGWTKDFQICLYELRGFLRGHGLPLPLAFFSDEIDCSARMATLAEEEFSKCQKNKQVQLRLQNELTELSLVQPESMDAYEKKRNQILVIKRRIDQLRGDGKRKKTEEMRKVWNDKYLELRELNPEKSDRWIAQQIAKLPISKGKSSDTIRKNMKNKK